MKQRIALGQALLDDPNVIILDEPTSGLDPRGMAETREILKNLRSGRHDLTILMSSHMLYEVSDLCDRVAMINHGRLLVHDDISAVTASSGNRSVKAKVNGPITEDMMKNIGGLSNVVSAERTGTMINIVLKGGSAEQARLMADMIDLNIGMYSMAESENTLETRYLELIKETK